MYRIYKQLLCITAFCIWFLAMGLSGCAAKEIVNLQKEGSSGKDGEELKQETPGQEESETVQNEKVCVYVCGEVKSPGVYELPSGSRIYEAIEKAGGMTENAAFSYLNQAEILSDGGRVYVPNVQENADQNAAWQEESDTSKGTNDHSSFESNGKININKASKEELMTLTGIGESKAEDIINYRTENGPFQTIEDLKQIRGIKDGVFGKIKEEITV